MKNSNEVIRVVYDLAHNKEDSRKPARNFTASAAATAGVKITNWLYVSANLSFAWYRANFSYDKVTTLMSSGTSSTERAAVYEKDILNIGLGLGLTFAIK